MFFKLALWCKYRVFISFLLFLISYLLCYNIFFPVFLSCLVSYLIFRVGFWKTAAAGCKCGVSSGPLFSHCWLCVYSSSAPTVTALAFKLCRVPGWFGWVFFLFVIYFSAFIRMYGLIPDDSDRNYMTLNSLVRTNSIG